MNLPPVIKRFDAERYSPNSGGKHWCVRDAVTAKLLFVSEGYGKQKAIDIAFAMNYALTLAQDSPFDLVAQEIHSASKPTG